MMQTEGRNGSFSTGAYATKFHTMQAGAGREGFKPQSVLETNQVFAPANGMSTADRSRSPLKGHIHSVNGESRDTYDKRMWTSPTPYRTYG